MFQVAISVVISRVFGAIFAQVLDPKATTFSFGVVRSLYKVIIWLKIIM